MQIIIGSIVLLVGIVFVFVYVNINSKYYQNENKDIMSIDYLVRICETEIVKEVTKDTTHMIAESIIDGTFEEQRDAFMKYREMLQDFRSRCRYGDPTAKKYMISMLRSIIKDKLLTKEEQENRNEYGKIFDVIPDPNADMYSLRNANMNYMWEILVKKIQKKTPKVFKYLDDNYSIFAIKKLSTPNNSELLDYGSEVSIEDFMHIWEKEMEDNKLTREDLIDVITQIVYSKSYGYGIFDTLTYLDMDEFQSGVNGIDTRLHPEYTGLYTMLRSIWVVMKRVRCRLMFLTHDNYDTMLAVTKHISEKTGSVDLSESNPSKSIDDYRGRRVTVSRPGVSTGYQLFYRVDQVGYMSAKDAMCPTKHGVEYFKNSDLLYRVCRLAVKGCLTSAIVGDQGVGKTSWLRRLFDFCNLTGIRVVEDMARELRLEELYPEKNISSMLCTQYRSFTDLLTYLKKTSGDVTIVGEIANKIQGGQLVEAATVGSRFTLFTCHPKDEETLIEWVAQAYLMSTGTDNMRAAVQEVSGLIRLAIRPFMYESYLYGKDWGRMYAIERISTMIPRKRKKFPITDDTDDAVKAINKLTETFKEVYTREQDLMFDYWQLLHFDKENAAYVPDKWFSSYDLASMKDNLTPEDKEELQKLKDDYFGGGDCWIGADQESINQPKEKEEEKEKIENEY